MIRPIRFALPVRRLRDPNGAATHALVGFKYLQRLSEAGIFTVRPVPLYTMPFGIFEDTEWSELKHVFIDHEIQRAMETTIPTAFGGTDEEDTGNQAPPGLGGGHFVNPNILIDRMGTDYINVVCGYGMAFVDYWTAGVYNVAITVSWPHTPPKQIIPSLEAYDVVCAPNAADVKALSVATGLDVKHLPIDVQKLTDFFTSGYDTKPRKNR